MTFIIFINKLLATMDHRNTYATFMNLGLLAYFSLTTNAQPGMLL